MVNNRIFNYNSFTIIIKIVNKKLKNKQKYKFAEKQNI